MEEISAAALEKKSLLNRAHLLNNWRREVAKMESELGRPPARDDVLANLELARKQLGVLQQALQTSSPPVRLPGNDTLFNQADTLFEPIPLLPAQAKTRDDPLCPLLDRLAQLEDDTLSVILWRVGLTGEEPLDYSEIARRLHLSATAIMDLEEAALRQLQKPQART